MHKMNVSIFIFLFFYDTYKKIKHENIKNIKGCLKFNSAIIKLHLNNIIIENFYIYVCIFILKKYFFK